MDQLEIGKTYEVEFNPNESSGYVLKFDSFKPQSLNNDQKGTIEIKNSKVEINLENNFLTGKCEPKTSEYALLWDGQNSKFLLEKVVASFNVKKSERKKPEKIEKKTTSGQKSSPPRQQTYVPNLTKSNSNFIKPSKPLTINPSLNNPSVTLSSPVPLLAPKFLPSDSEEESSSESESDDSD
eukprot:gene8089-12550_t